MAKRKQWHQPEPVRKVNFEIDAPPEEVAAQLKGLIAEKMHLLPPAPPGMTYHLEEEHLPGGGITLALAVVPAPPE